MTQLPITLQTWCLAIGLLVSSNKKSYIQRDIRRDFGKSNNFNIVSVLFDFGVNLLTVKITFGYETQTKWHHFVKYIFINYYFY